MSLLARVSILSKILGIVALIAIMVCGAAWHATSRMNAIDAGYSRFLERDAVAWVSIPRLSGSLVKYQTLGYRIAAEQSEARARELAPQLELNMRDALQFVAVIKAKTPQYAREAADIEDKVRELHAVAMPVVELALRHANAQALQLMQQKVDPVLDGSLALTRALRDRLDQRIKTGSDDLTAATGSTILSTWLMVAGLLAVAAGLTFLIGHFGISAPSRQLAALLERMAAGEHVEVTGTGRRDEVGTIARAVNGIRAMLSEKARREAEEKATEKAEADRLKRAAAEREFAQQRSADDKAAAERKAALRALADTFEKAVGGIVDTVTSASAELEAAAGTLTRTAATTQQLSTIVASASEEASSNVQSVASATEEMTGSVGEISRQVQESSSIADEAVRQARNTDARIAELSQAANRIGDVVKLITAIAEQTNLLALNATIEAARAGEAGKGFAVVAQEVKALAAQTAKATGDIGTQIAGMQMATVDSVAAIKEIGSTIQHISRIAAAIAAAVEEQGAATQEIARNVQQAAKGTAQVANNIVNVNRGASETGSASSEVLASARSLSTESHHLKLEVRKFLATVRAA